VSTRHWARWWAIATGVLAVVATVVGWVGFARYLGPSGTGSASEFAPARFFDLLFYSFQLFVLGPSPFGGPPYGWWLSIASFLAPLTTVMAVVQAVSAASRSSWEAWKLRHAYGHDVVVGRTPEAFALAQKLAAPTRTTTTASTPTTAPTAITAPRRRPVVLLGSDVGADVARRHDVSVVEGEAVDEEALRAAGVPGAAHVFALDTSGAANAAVAMHVRSLHEKALQQRSRLERTRRGKWLLANPRPAKTWLATWLLGPPVHARDITVHCRVDGAELGAAMRARRLGVEGKGGFRVDFFNLFAIAAGVLLDEHKPGSDAVIVGSDDDPFTAAVHRELVRRRRQAGVQSPLPPVPYDDAGQHPVPTGSTYVCGSDPDEVLRVGLHLLLKGHPHVVLCLGRRAALAGALEQRLFDRVLGQLSVFGVIDAACDPQRLEHNALNEQLARALHAYYLNAFGGGGQASHVLWDELDDAFKADNRQQADHIGAKLTTLSAVIVPATDGLPAFVLTEAEIEDLATMEHDRWMKNKLDAGFVHGPERKGKMHPDLLPWDQLDERVKEKDRMFVHRLSELLAREDLAIVRQAAPPTT
jgi:RyR domain/TrkA-N domain